MTDSEQNRTEEMTLVPMKLHRKFSFAAVLVIMTIAACSSAPRDERAGIDARACFDSQRVTRFSPLNDRFLYLRAGSDEHYLLTVGGLCPGLGNAIGITISPGTFSRICSDSGATITYRDAQMPCRITAVEAVESRDAAEALVKQRTAPSSD